MQKKTICTKPIIAVCILLGINNSTYAYDFEHNEQQYNYNEIIENGYITHNYILKNPTFNIPTKTTYITNKAKEIIYKMEIIQKKDISQCNNYKNSVDTAIQKENFKHLSRLYHKREISIYSDYKSKYIETGCYADNGSSYFISTQYPVFPLDEKNMSVFNDYKFGELLDKKKSISVDQKRFVKTKTFQHGEFLSVLNNDNKISAIISRTQFKDSDSCHKKMNEVEEIFKNNYNMGETSKTTNNISEKKYSNYRYNGGAHCDTNNFFIYLIGDAKYDDDSFLTVQRYMFKKIIFEPTK